MIVLDTNVVSETLRPAPDPRVMRWLAEHAGGEPHLAAVVVAELLAGVERMPPGRRRIALADELDLQLDQEYRDRVLPFDLEAARVYAVLVAASRAAGHPIPPFDAQIAAVCLVHDATLVTRNVRDFAGLGVRLVDPWTA